MQPADTSLDTATVIKVSGSGKVKIAPVSNCSAQDNQEAQIVFIWKIGD